MAASTQYKGGSIKRIYLKNFMTYKKLELFPIAGLNLLVGPNGSGKSSIVCAICLGLGGKPTFTGRHLRLNEFITHGEKMAFIEIDLDNPESNNSIIISREIRSNGSSFYKLNGKEVKELQVEKAVGMFNIQVNNLCQFLPQEKVAEFSRMDSKQLLVSMQQAVGNQEMFDNYQLLVEKRKKSRDLDTEIENLKKTIAGEKKKNDSVETDIKNYEDYKQNEEKLDKLVKKRPVLKYMELHGEVMALRNIKIAISKELQEIREKNEPLLAKLKRHENDMLANEKEWEELKSLTDEAETAAKKLEESITKIDEMIEDEKNRLELNINSAKDLKKRIVQQEKKIADSERQHEVLLQEHDSLKHEAEKAKEEKNKVFEIYSNTKVECSGINQQKQYLMQRKTDVEQELNSMNDLGNKKLRNLEHRDRVTFTATGWLKNNQHLFKKPVHGPIMLLIDVVDKRYVKYVESCIPNQDMLMFVCEAQEDTEVLIQHLRIGMNLQINFAVAPAGGSNVAPRIPLSQLQQEYRFTSYIKDIITGPDPIISFLCSQHRIHEIPFGDERTETFLRNSGIRNPFDKYYISDFGFTIKKSRYGARNESQNSYQIREKGYLMPGNLQDSSKLQKEKEFHEIQQNLKQSNENEIVLTRKMAELESRLGELRRVEKDFAHVEERIKMQKQFIIQYKNLLKDIRNKKIDIPFEKQSAKEKIKQLIEEKCRDIEEYNKASEKLVSSQYKKAGYRYISECFEEFCQQLAQQSKDFFEQLKKKEAEQDIAKNKHNTVKTQAKAALEEAEQICGIKLQPMSEAAKIKFNSMYGSLPTDSRHLEMEISQLTAQLNCMYVTDESVIQEYERRKKKIQETDAEITANEKEFSKLNRNIEAVKCAWLEPLEDLVSKISDTFGRYFRKLGCVGEVAIKKGADVNDFDKYGLSIRVKFRDVQGLNELSAALHSGGECSVATIVFILSLQELTEVPFRCVDEINQGMDSANERKIFELVAASAEKSSQYFLLTPKLLQRLEYSEGMQVHIIGNGPFLLAKNWDLKKIIEEAGKAIED